MKKKTATKGIPSKLRALAENQLVAGIDSSTSGERRAAPDAQRLVHELEVHQIELQLQNEELQRARGEIEEVLARYTDLFEFAPVGYFTVNRDGLIQQANLAGAGLLGLERSRLTGNNLRLWVAADCCAEFDAFFAGIFESENKVACEITLTTNGPATLALALTGVAVGDRQACRIVATDITRCRRAELERQQLQSQLAHSQKLEAIGTFAGGMAHDFNNILGGILAGLSLLDLELGEANEHRSDIHAMQALAKRGADLTRQLLGFARRGKYNVKPLNLVQIVENTCSLFGRMNKHFDVELDIAPDTWSVLMDHAQLEQSLLNLLVNSAQAMLHGGRIHVHTENVEFADDALSTHGVAPGRYAKLEIVDTGIGMDAETQARVFEPFFTTKSPGYGSGLGLASVYGIVKSHAGFIEVQSELGKGTTFRLFLPATDRPIAATSVPPKAIQHGSGTILIVDDEETIAKVCARSLERIGYEVLTAYGGRQAIELFRRHKSRISLVILDMIMPDMSGHQTYDALQEIAPGTKVLLCTGYSLDGDAQELMTRGCNGFIQKPFDIASLSAKLREIM